MTDITVTEVCGHSISEVKHLIMLWHSIAGKTPLGQVPVGYKLGFVPTFRYAIQPE